MESYLDRGSFLPGGTVEVEIVLIKMDALPTTLLTDSLLTDRFMVMAAWMDESTQSTHTAVSRDSAPNAFWKRGGPSNPDDLFTMKLVSQITRQAAVARARAAPKARSADSDRLQLTSTLPVHLYPGDEITEMYDSYS